ATEPAAKHGAVQRTSRWRCGSPATRRARRFDRYNIVSTKDLRAAVTRTARHVASLLTERLTPGDEHGQNTENGTSRASARSSRLRNLRCVVGGSGWESNPPLRASARSRTALKAAQVTRPESLPGVADHKEAPSAKAARQPGIQSSAPCLPAPPASPAA